MASGRLGSVVLEPIETAKVYTNNSGNAASVSLVAKTLSTTANASMTVKLDSANITPQTTTVIDNNSYGKDTVLIDTTSNYTSVVGHFKHLPTPTYTKTSDSTIATLTEYRNTHELIPENNSSIFPNEAIPITYSGNTYFYSRSDYFGANLPDMRKSQIANTTQPSGNVAQRGMAYNNRGVVTDIYSAGSVSVGLNSSGYMSQSMYANGTANGADQATNSVWYQYCNSSPSDPTVYRSNLYLSGGLLVCWDSTTYGRGTFTFYNKNETSNNIEKIIDGNTLLTGYVYGFRYTPSFTHTYGTIAWMTYNPTNQKHYILMRKDSGGNYAYYRINTAVALAKIATSSGSLVSYNTIPAINSGVGGTLFEEISAPSEWSMGNSSWLRYPIKIIGQNKWLFVEYNGSTWNYWQTLDLENWTKLSATSYYNKVLSDTELLKSDATNLSYISSNIASVADSGTLELNTSFNTYEKTGLVLSNGDSIYIKNDSSVNSIAVNVMGYEG